MSIRHRPHRRAIVICRPNFAKQSVYYRTKQPPGTIIVNAADRHLYLIMGNGVALRYGVGVGRDGLRGAASRRLRSSANGQNWCHRRR